MQTRRTETTDSKLANGLTPTPANPKKDPVKAERNATTDGTNLLVVKTLVRLLPDLTATVPGAVGAVEAACVAELDEEAVEALVDAAVDEGSETSIGNRGMIRRK